jgi:DNA-binding response OmpR family regulator
MSARLLLIDDDARLGEMLGEYLRARGCATLECPRTQLG